MERPRRSEYTPNDLLTFREAGSLDITPKFQRRSVWNLSKRSYFVDSLLQQMPVPSIYLREIQSDDYTKTVRQVIDGQQRIRAVLEYIDGDYSLSRGLSEQWAGKPFKKLSVDERDRIRNYHFPAEVFVGISDPEVLNIFARMNTFSVQLNRQELLNGSYFGRFKQTCYSLGFEHLEFWRKSRIFTEMRIARMNEVELSGECVILVMDGAQDKKASLKRFYADYDEAFPDQKRVTNQFRGTVDEIVETIGTQTLSETAFRGVPLFYSLFGAVHHLRYGSDLETRSLKRRLNSEEREALRNAVLRLSSIVEASKEDQVVPTKYQQFLTACSRQTDNIQPRRIRMHTILREAGLS